MLPLHTYTKQTGRSDRRIFKVVTPGEAKTAKWPLHHCLAFDPDGSVEITCEDGWGGVVTYSDLEAPEAWPSLWISAVRIPLKSITDSGKPITLDPR